MSAAPEVGSPEWRRLVTASKAAAIIGVSPWESPYSIWHEMKHGTTREQNAAMARGNYLEPAILAWWRDQHRDELGGEAWITQEWKALGDWAGCTVDLRALLNEGEHHEADVIVEAKSAARMDEWGRPGTDEIPAYYLAQVYFQLAVTGAVRCYIPVIGPFLEFTEYVVEADEAFQADILARCRAFYDTLSADVEPELDTSVATYNIVRKAHSDIDPDAHVELTPDTASEFIDALNAAKATEERARLAKTTVLDLMGRAKYATCNGVTVARRQADKYAVGIRQVAKTTTAITQGDAA